MNWIEHPSRNGNLESFGELNYETLLVKPAQGAHYFDFRSTKGMMSVMDLLQRQFVSSMMTPCATRLQRTCWKTGMISERFKNFSDTMT
jgi:hypothetical protein